MCAGLPPRQRSPCVLTSSSCLAGRRKRTNSGPESEQKVVTRWRTPGGSLFSFLTFGSQQTGHFLDTFLHAEWTHPASPADANVTFWLTCGHQERTCGTHFARFKALRDRVCTHTDFKLSLTQTVRSSRGLCDPSTMTVRSIRQSAP